ncbi:hypothetical protein ONZ45_g11786 [Pleurotus djamor]|nr:hypothetical protein ONZ45_g11786 [Pleurotus djamor]
MSSVPSSTPASPHVHSDRFALPYGNLESPSGPPSLQDLQYSYPPMDVTTSAFSLTQNPSAYPQEFFPLPNPTMNGDVEIPYGDQGTYSAGLSYSLENVDGPSYSFQNSSTGWNVEDDQGFQPSPDDLRPAYDEYSLPNQWNPNSGPSSSLHSFPGYSLPGEGHSSVVGSAPAQHSDGNFAGTSANTTPICHLDSVDFDSERPPDGNDANLQFTQSRDSSRVAMSRPQETGANAGGSFSTVVDAEVHDLDASPRFQGNSLEHDDARMQRPEGSSAGKSPDVERISGQRVSGYSVDHAGSSSQRPTSPMAGSSSTLERVTSSLTGTEGETQSFRGSPRLFGHLSDRFDTSSRRSPSPIAGSSSDIERVSSPSSSPQSYMFRKRPLMSVNDPPPRRRRRVLPPSPPPPEPIPEFPSPSYLEESLVASSTLSQPTACRKLLILDLNGTIVLRTPYKAATRQDPTFDPYADPYRPRPLRTVLPRPFLTSFREYLFHPKTQEWLDTMVWSSAQPHSVEDMVKKAFCPLPNPIGEDGSDSIPRPRFRDKDDLINNGKLLAVWARDTMGLSKESYFQKTQTTKNMTKPWGWLEDLRNRKQRLPGNIVPTQHSAKSTLLLDDSPLKARLQPYNHICIKEYTYEMREADLEASSFDAEESGFEVDGYGYEGYDTSLLAVVGVLDAVKLQSNVASWVRSGGLLGGKELPPQAQEEDADEASAPVTEASAPPVAHHLEPAPTPSSEIAPVVADIQRPIVNGEDHVMSADAQPARPIPQADAPLLVELEPWAEDEGNLRYWVDRGVVALKELGIEVVPGVIPTVEEADRELHLFQGDGDVPF